MKRHRVAELREACARRGLSDDGKKDELIERLQRWNDAATSEPSPPTEDHGHATEDHGHAIARITTIAR